MFPTALSPPVARGFAVAFALLAVVVVGLRVDLTPRVEGEFFFADDDPQLASARAVGETFAPGAQVILRVTPERADSGGAALSALVDALAGVEGVESTLSIVEQDPEDPLYGRILTTPSSEASNVVLQVAPDAGPELVAAIESVVAESEGLEIALSGAPVVVEWIRRSLRRDLVVFTGAAALVFALLVAVLSRDAAVVIGTGATCLAAVSTTFLILHLAGVRIGLLTANLATIVFVLTLSHMVFMTVNVRDERRRAASGAAGPVDGAEVWKRGVRRTFEGSFWAMTTTLLGFLSLLVATARPLRELGMAGAVGTVIALMSAYLFFPPFLERGQGGPARRSAPGDGTAGPRIRPRRPVLLTTAAVAVLFGIGLLRVDTDPSLLGYFAPDSPLGAGLTQIDADGGSSALHLVVAFPDGSRLDTDEGYASMSELQRQLETHPATGVVLGPSVFIDQARTLPLAGFLPLSALLDIASSPQLDEVALGFVTADRTRGLFSLRMREGPDATAPGGSRAEIVAELRGLARAAGLEPVEIAGLYDLQRRLGDLIRGSLIVGVGGLLLLFLGVAFVVAREWGLALRMWACLAVVPLVVLGTFGWTGIPVDIITSPAASVALAMGVDAMVHLVVRVRRLQRSGVSMPWSEGLRSVAPAVLAAAGILTAGFGIFVLSDFPPTRRFGLAVVLGTAAAAVLALVVLPAAAAPVRATPPSTSPPDR